MIRKIALAAAAGAVALSGLAVLGAGTATAATPTIATATSANISCTITAKAKLSPALKNSWDKEHHNGVNDQPGEGLGLGQHNDNETNAAVIALPDTLFSTPGANSTTSKAKSVSCTGSATDGTNTATIVSVKVDLVQSTQAIDNPPLQEDNTCTGLLAGNQPGDVAATYGTIIKFKTTGAKLANATTTGQGIAPAGIGFAVSGGTVGGSLAGGNGKTQANLADGATLTAVTAAHATSAAPVPASTTCEASLKLKPGTATLKKPKGLKKIAIGQSFLDATPAGASTICLRKGTTCP